MLDKPPTYVMSLILFATICNNNGAFINNNTITKVCFDGQ